ncbi:uncharacterized protein [Diabrotica undecimpunctata]|uniref:uncharacterized protein n=1 Tax=Diabrotica undecimpunctata TaxID=50387 RepID=UPI003B638ED9
MGDFNAKLRCKLDRTEVAIGPYGFGQRNERGEMFLGFLVRNGLFAMNSFFKKSPQRKWTWASPDGVTKNEIDFVLTNNKDMVHDVITVLNSCSVGSDQRMVRAKIVLNLQKQRYKMITKTHPIGWNPIENTMSFEEEILRCLETTNIDVMDVETLNDNLIKAIKNAEKKRNTNPRRDKEEKISEETKRLMETRRELKNKNDTNARVLQQLNKDINKAVRKDVRQYNTKKITTVVKENESLKVLKRCQALCKKNIVKIADRNGKVVTDKDKIIRVVEEFYTELYRERDRKTASS